MQRWLNRLLEHQLLSYADELEYLPLIDIDGYHMVMLLHTKCCYSEPIHSLGYV